MSENESEDKDDQEIINYREALLYSEKELENRDISLNLIKQLHFICQQIRRAN